MPHLRRKEREAHLAKVSELYCKGMLQMDIAHQLGVVPSQIMYDMKILMARWKESQIQNIDERKIAELTRIDQLELTYWDGWARSLKDKRVTMLAKDKGQWPQTHTSIKKERRDGSATFLQGVQWCIEQRCKILGLYAPSKIDVEWKIRKIAEENGMDPDEAVAEAQRILSASH